MARDDSLLVFSATDPHALADRGVSQGTSRHEKESGWTMPHLRLRPSRHAGSMSGVRDCGWGESFLRPRLTAKKQSPIRLDRALRVCCLLCRGMGSPPAAREP